MYSNKVQCTVAVGKQLSTLASSPGMYLAGVYLPGNLTGTVLTLFAQLPAGSAGKAPGNGAVQNTSSGSPVSYTVAAGQYLAIPRDIGIGIDSVEFNTGTNQSTTDATLVAVFVPYGT